MSQGIKEGISTAHAIQYTLYQLPEIIVMVLPAACLMSTLITLSSMARRNELVAMFASAIPLARIAFVLLCLVFIICCASFIITDRVIPPLSKIRAHFYRTVILKKPDLHTEINNSRIWYRSDNLIYNIRAFELRTDTIHGISIYSFDQKFSVSQQIDARRAKFKNGQWLLENGVVTIFDGQPIVPMTQKFSSKSLKLREKPEDFREIEKEVETLRLKHLWTFIRRNQQAGIDTTSYEVLFWSKISIALVPLVMAILAIPFGAHRNRHTSLARDVTLCFLVVVLYWLFFSTALSMGKSGSLPPVVAAWLPSVFFCIFGVGMIARGGRQ